MSKERFQIHLEAAAIELQLALSWAAGNGEHEALTTVLWQTVCNALEYCFEDEGHEES